MTDYWNNSSPDRKSVRNSSNRVTKRKVPEEKCAYISAIDMLDRGAFIKTCGLIPDRLPHI